MDSNSRLPDYFKQRVVRTDGVATLDAAAFCQLPQSECKIIVSTIDIGPRSMDIIN